MGNVYELSEIRDRAKHLLEMLDSAQLSSLDFNNREHLQVIELCLDLAIDRAKQLK